MICLRVNRVMFSAWILSAPVWRITSSRADSMTALPSATAVRIRCGTADLVNRPDAASTSSLPKASIAASTADFGS
jgi:hypothetical protein